eukprot:CAMPEP_0174755508 /NCGR_PEP_ID=MMETSP1094-20130205/106284_1 /TAXON_ID=156173 /ORGANISM="Chrysochromulina brevifilum, Strain UTEX LB 985" /LENGTH=33 /DNA_ID= /DNA_START= /DNA_END= /DNA_ORIENTATION=
MFTAPPHALSRSTPMASPPVLGDAGLSESSRNP